MLSKKRIDEAEEPMRSPLNLCDELGLTPTLKQYDILERFAARPKLLELVGDENYETERAVGIQTIWRILEVQGSTCIVLTPTQQIGADFMGFLDLVTQRCHPQLAQVSGFPRWNVLQFGGMTAWEIRVMPNKAAIVRERAPQALVSVILGARNPDLEFVEACKALEECSTHEKNTLVRVW